MRVSAVVLNWRDSRRTVRCVRGLLAIEGVENVFVVDNESDGTLRGELDASLERRAWTLTEVATNTGFAAGVNLGIKQSLQASADFVLVINNDAVLDSDSFSHLVNALLDDPRIGLVAPSIRDPDGTIWPSSGRTSPWTGTTSHVLSTGSVPDFVTWACVLVRREVFDVVGFLDERFFMYWEDVDYCLRLTAAGIAFAEVNHATVMHEVSSNRATHSVAIKAYHTWSGLVFAEAYRGRWNIGKWRWMIVSLAANLVRLRRDRILGLFRGVQLAREGSNPAWRSKLRAEQFGLGYSAPVRGPAE